MVEFTLHSLGICEYSLCAVLGWLCSYSLKERVKSAVMKKPQSLIKITLSLIKITIYHCDYLSEVSCPFTYIKDNKAGTSCCKNTPDTTRIDIRLLKTWWTLTPSHILKHKNKTL